MGGSFHEKRREVLSLPEFASVEPNIILKPGQETGTVQNTLVGPEDRREDQTKHDSLSTSPLSPYSADRAAMRNLTMPTTPNLDIPPSPSGSPPPGSEDKFKHFFQLKSQGINFNEKLAESSALKNPMLLQKLMISAGLSEIEQYSTTLHNELWDPSAFPHSVYKEELAKSQQEISKEKEEKRSRMQREKVDFIPASVNDSLVSGHDTLSISAMKGSKAGITDRLAASLDSSKTQASGRR
ncbi:MAG: hypothetical protein Q9219_007411 [cf. Caloplaca sp. 3 TL-2023]